MQKNDYFDFYSFDTNTTPEVLSESICGIVNSAISECKNEFFTVTVCFESHNRMAFVATNQYCYRNHDKLLAKIEKEFSW